MSKADQKGRHQLCTHSKTCQKTVTRHIWKDYEELAAMNLKKLALWKWRDSGWDSNPRAVSCKLISSRRNQVVSYGLGRRLLAHQIGGKA